MSSDESPESVDDVIARIDGLPVSLQDSREDNTDGHGLCLAVHFDDSSMRHEARTIAARIKTLLGRAGYLTDSAITVTGRDSDDISPVATFYFSSPVGSINEWALIKEAVTDICADAEVALKRKNNAMDVQLGDQLQSGISDILSNGAPGDKAEQIVAWLQRKYALTPRSTGRGSR